MNVGAASWIASVVADESDPASRCTRFSLDDREITGTRSKLAANAYARLFDDLFGLEVVIVRLMMVYGPGQAAFDGTWRPGDVTPADF